MRVTDLKQILWWLCGGLLVCSGLIVGYMIWKPHVSRQKLYSKIAASCVTKALSQKTEQQQSQQDFKRYEATYGLKIDGIAPPPPPPPDRPVAKQPPPVKKQKYPLSDFVVLTAIWTNGVFYRAKTGAPTKHGLRVGEEMPKEHVAQIDPPIRLLRIEKNEPPTRAVFLVWGKEEVLLVPKEGILLQAPANEPVRIAASYKGPTGTVRPNRRAVPRGFSTDKATNALILGEEVQEIVRNNSEALMRGIAWSPHEKGVLVSRIADGSLAKQLIQKAGGTLLQQGDVLMSVNGVKVQSRSQIVSHFKKNPVKAGTPIKVEVLRFGNVVTRTVRMPNTQ